MSKNENSNSCDFSIRWRPDFRYRDDKLDKIGLDLFKSKDPSIVDKEAYRLTLASLRGELAQGIGKIDVGSYSIPAGKEYNPNEDFSFLNRKDLTIVELDEYIKNMTERLTSADKSLSEVIKAELAKAEKKHQEFTSVTLNKNDEVKE